MPLLLTGADVDHPRIELIWVDRGYTGTLAQWIREQLGWQVEVVQHPPRYGRAWQWVPDPDDPMILRFRWVKVARIETGFRGILPRRWVVERSFAWLSHSRRLSKDYERLCETSEALIYAAMSRIMVRRLARTLLYQTVSSELERNCAESLRIRCVENCAGYHSPPE